MWATVSKRQYLLKMKAKYTGIYETLLHKIDYSCTYSHCIDGQKIAKKLCKGISKETGKMKKLLG